MRQCAISCFESELTLLICWFQTKQRLPLAVLDRKRFLPRLGASSSARNCSNHFVLFSLILSHFEKKGVTVWSERAACELVWTISFGRKSIQVNECVHNMDTLPANEFCRRVFVLFQKGLNYLHNENTLIWAPAHYSTYIRNSLLFALLSHPSSWRTRMQSSLAQPNPRRRTSCTDRQITSLPTIHNISTPLGIIQSTSSWQQSHNRPLPIPIPIHFNQWSHQPSSLRHRQWRRPNRDLHRPSIAGSKNF